MDTWHAASVGLCQAATVESAVVSTRARIYAGCILSGRRSGPDCRLLWGR